MQIIPAVLANSEADYIRDLSRLERTNLFKWVHIDFMDNKFVLNKSIDPTATAKYPVSLKKEAHLMVQHPKSWIDQLARAGFKRVLFHLESEDDQDECIDCAKKNGLEVGLVLKHETPLDNLVPYIAKIDRALLMSVVPGFQGQPFIEGVLQKISNFKSKNWPVKVGVDGAVRDTNIIQLVNAGVDYVIAGSFLLKGDIDENLEKLWEALRQAQGKIK